MSDQELKMKEAIRNTFDTIAVGYDIPSLRFFQRSAEHLAGHLGLTGNEHVLDVATGTATSAIALASRLPGGEVTGIDFSRGMLDIARAKIKAGNLRNITLLRMDMEAMELADGGFDAACCAFGVFFVRNMEAQVRRMAEKVKTDGRILMTTFEERTFSPLVDLLFNRLKAYGIDVPPESINRLCAVGQCRGLFQSAGLGDITVGREEVGYHLQDARGWWDVVWNAGFRRFVGQLPSEGMERFMEEHLREVQGLATSDGVWLQVSVLYTTGVVV